MLLIDTIVLSLMGKTTRTRIQEELKNARGNITSLRETKAKARLCRRILMNFLTGTLPEGLGAFATGSVLTSEFGKHCSCMILYSATGSV
jgi:hypothetical protein